MSTAAEAQNEQKKRRFERWRRTLPKHTQYLADLVAERIVPEFEQRGFVWHKQASAGFLYLVHPEPGCWPAVQLRFHPRAHPMAFVDVGCLPAVCRQWNGTEFAAVPRQDAFLVDGLAYFYLSNPGRKANNAFGYRYFSLSPKRRLATEIGAMKSLLPRLFEVFDEKLLLNKERWPEVADLLTLCGDRTDQFDTDPSGWTG